MSLTVVSSLIATAIFVKSGTGRPYQSKDSNKGRFRSRPIFDHHQHPINRHQTLLATHQSIIRLQSWHKSNIRCPRHIRLHLWMGPTHRLQRRTISPPSRSGILVHHHRGPHQPLRLHPRGHLRPIQHRIHAPQRPNRQHRRSTQKLP